MSNRRRIRRPSSGWKAGGWVPTLPRYPHKTPAISTVRGWLRQLRQYVRRLDAGFYECGWKCRCAFPHDPGLRALQRAAAWSRTSVINASTGE